MTPMEYEVIPVDMDEETERKWVDRCIEDVRADLKNREPREDQWRVAVAQYMGRLEREDASPRGSKLDFSQSMELAEQLIARIVSPLMGYRKLHATRERIPGARDFAQILEDLCDWVTDKSSVIRGASHEIRSACVYGVAWTIIRWVHKTRKITLWKDVEEVQDDGTIMVVRAEVEEEVVTKCGAYEASLHPPNVIYPEESGEDPEEAPRIAVQYREWPEQIREKQRSGAYRDDFEVESLSRVAPEKRDLYLDTVEDDDGERGWGDEARNPVTIWEIMRKHPKDGKEIILQVEPESGIVLQHVYNWAHDDPRGISRFAFSEIMGSLDGISLMYKLEPMHRAYSAILNMVLDSGQRSIEKVVIALRRLGLGEFFKNGQLDTGFYEADALNAEDLQNGIQQFSLSEGFTQLQWVMDLLMRHMNNVSNIAAAMFGREVAERPTRGGTELVVGESKQPLSLMLERFLEFKACQMRTKISRYRQMYPYGMEWYLESKDPMTQELIRRSMEWPSGYWRDQVLVEMAVSSQTMSKEIRKQEFAQMVMQLPDVIKKVLEITQAASDPNSPLSLLAAQMAQMYLGVVQEWLEENDVQGSEAADPQTAQLLQQAGMAYVGQIQGLEQQVQQLQQKIQSLLPPAPPPAGPPGLPGPGMAPGPGPMGGPPPGPPMPPPGGIG